jgi:hypothetical protein
VPSERVPRQIDRLLDEADVAMAALDWQMVRDRGQAVLAADPDNADGRNYLATAERGLAGSWFRMSPRPTFETRKPCRFSMRRLGTLER